MLVKKILTQEKTLRITYILLALLALLRFISLDKIPIFIDEQTHLYYGQLSFTDFDSLFETVQYRIFPVVPWVLGFAQMISRQSVNPLILGRAIMVLSDIISCVLVYHFAKKLISKKYALIAALIYLGLPLNFFHSRVILLEPMTNMFFLAALLFFLKVLDVQNVLSVRSRFTSMAFTTAMLALAFLSKPTIIVSFVTLPLLFVNRLIGEKTQKLKFKIRGFALITLVVLFVMIIAPIVIPVWHKFADLFVLNNMDLIITNFKKNLWLTWWWSKVYITLPIILLTLASLIYTIVFNKWKVMWLHIWLFLIITLNSIFALFFFPRHMYPMAAPISLVSAFLIFEISRKSNYIFAILLTLLAISFSLRINSQILLNPETAPIALEDKQQFFQDWTSGVGVENIANDLKELSKDQKILALVEKDGGFGWSLQHLYKSGSTTFIESEIDEQTILGLDSLSTQYQEIYLVLNRDPDPPRSWPIALVSAYPKLLGVRYIKIYKYKYEATNLL